MLYSNILIKFTTFNNTIIDICGNFTIVLLHFGKQWNMYFIHQSYIIKDAPAEARFQQNIFILRPK